jgi:hypothetical protein
MMSEAGKLFLLAKAELRDRWRWARQHLYALLILAPLVLGMTYMTLVRATSYDLVLETPSTVVQLLLAILSVLAVIALNLSRASREIYHLRQPAIFSEALPVERVTHLHMALLARTGRTLVFGLVLLVLHSLWRDRLVADAAALGALLLSIVLIALSEVYAALNWIHWGSTRDKQAAGLALVVLLATAALGGLLLLLFFNPMSATKIVASIAAPVLPLAVLDRATIISLVYALGYLPAGIIYLLARRSHGRWRATDIDYAQRLREGGRLNLYAIGIFNRWIPQSASAMLARDLRLTLRTFSSAVYVGAGLCVLLILLLFMLLTTDVLPSGPEFIGGLMTFGWASATWLPAVISIKLTCVLAVAALASVLPVLVYYQLPHMWLERATGASGECVWQAKLWYARLVTLPVVLLIYTVGVVGGVAGGQGGGVPLYYVAPLLAECLWLWWLASTAVGALAFEIPDRPELSIVLILTVSISTGALTAVLWPMGLAFYGMGFAQAAARGGARARYYLATEGE